MKDWEVLKCDNCGAPMKPTGHRAVCPYCGTVYVRASSDTIPRGVVEFAFGETPPMSGAGWTPTLLCRDGRIEWSTVNPLALGEAPPMSGEEGWVDSFGNRYGAFDV